MLTHTQIKDRLDALKPQIEAVNTDLHELAVSIIGHAFIHGDVTLGDRLLEKMHGMDRKAMAQYLVNHGPFKATKDGFKLNKSFREQHEYAEQTLLDGTKWHDYVPSVRQVMQSFDLSKRVLGLIKQGETAQQEGKDTENMELARYLRDAVKQYNLDKAEALRLLAGDSPSVEAAAKDGLKLAA